VYTKSSLCEGVRAPSVAVARASEAVVTAVLVDLDGCLSGVREVTRPALRGTGCPVTAGCDAAEAERSADSASRRALRRPSADRGVTVAVAALKRGGIEIREMEGGVTLLAT
jgi:hypothetical protein